MNCGWELEDYEKNFKLSPYIACWQKWVDAQ